MNWIREHFIELAIVFGAILPMTIALWAVVIFMILSLLGIAE